MSSGSAVKKKPRMWMFILVLIVAAASLTITSVVSSRRQIQILTGPATVEQRQLFIEAIERPDLFSFFKSLPKRDKLAWARNLGLHDEPKLAKLIAVLLADLNEDIRSELTRSLKSLAMKQPEAVSMELKHGGGFQRLAVFEALKGIGERGLPIVAARLRDGETRANATAFLVERGRSTVPLFLSALQDESHDVRVAAADALAKLRAGEAVVSLTRLYMRALPEQQGEYLAALATIGDARSEAILTGALRDAKLQVPMRAQAALGLGRIGSSTAVSELWSMLEDADRQLADASLEGLQLSGDRALSSAGRDRERVIDVASGIHSPTADGIIERGLANGSRPMRLGAARAASGRASIAGTLFQKMMAADTRTEGDIIDALAGALLSTPEGRKLIARVPTDSIQAAFVRRRESLASG